MSNEEPKPMMLQKNETWLEKGSIAVKRTDCHQIAVRTRGGTAYLNDWIQVFKHLRGTKLLEMSDETVNGILDLISIEKRATEGALGVLKGASANGERVV